jgi:uncharacterized membrane protein
VAGAPGGGRLAGLREAARASFGAPAVAAVVLGFAGGLGLPALDAALLLELPVIRFTTEDAARSLLSTIATATLTVAALAFTVTLTAFTLSASQLSPRVLRSFRRDALSQATLAVLLGTSIYCMAVLVRLGASVRPGAIPNLSITLAVVLAAVAFVLFASFVAHLVRMLQPGAVVAAIAAEGRAAAACPYPAPVGRAAEPDEVLRSERLMREPGLAVRAVDDGYVVRVAGGELLALARDADGLVRHRAPAGEYVVAGDVLAEVWCPRPPSDLERRVRAAFALGEQRTVLQDLAFPVRQLADIALKALSPSVNDPTTAETAMNGLTTVLVRLAAADEPASVRADDRGRARLVAQAPGLDDLVRLGFEDVRLFAASYPALTVRLLGLLERVEAAAARHGRVAEEPARQAALLRAAARAEEHDADDAARVERAAARPAAPAPRPDA